MEGSSWRKAGGGYMKTEERSGVARVEARARLKPGADTQGIHRHCAPSSAALDSHSSFPRGAQKVIVEKSEAVRGYGTCRSL